MCHDGDSKQQRLLLGANTFFPSHVMMQAVQPNPSLRLEAAHSGSTMAAPFANRQASVNTLVKSLVPPASVLSAATSGSGPPICFGTDS